MCIRVYRTYYITVYPFSGILISTNVPGRPLALTWWPSAREKDHFFSSSSSSFGVMLASHLLQSTRIELFVYSLANTPGDPFTGWHVSSGVP